MFECSDVSGDANRTTPDEDVDVDVDVNGVCIPLPLLEFGVKSKLFNADAVVGVQSMAMIMSLYAGKKVFSTLPKNFTKSLPYKKIVYFNK